jgi:hypothetical protein
MIPIAQAEREYKLPTGTIRRDIHRKRFKPDEYQKLGRDWFITREAIEKIYIKASQQ